MGTAICVPASSWEPSLDEGQAQEGQNGLGHGHVWEAHLLDWDFLKLSGTLSGGGDWSSLEGGKGPL